MRYLTRRASWWGVGGGLAQAATLVSVAVTAHVVDKDVFGTYRQLVLLHGLITVLFMFSLGSAVLYHATEENGIEIGRRVFGLQVTLGTIASVVLFVSAPATAQLFSNPDLLPAQLVFAPYSAIVAVGMSVPVVLHVRNRLPYATVALIVLPASIALGLLVGAVAFGSAIAIAAGLVVGATIGVLASYGTAWLALRTPVLPLLSGPRRRILSYALPLGVAAGISLVGYQTDQIVVAVLASTATYAVYAAGAIEVPLVKIVRDALTVSAIPSMVQSLRDGDTHRFLSIWEDSIRVVGTVLLPLAVTMWLAAPAIIGLLYGEGFEDAVLYFRLYLLAIPLRLFWHDGILIATGRTRPAMAITGIFAGVNLALNLAGWYTIGIAALPLATVAAVGISAAIFLTVGARQLDISVWRLTPVRSLVPGSLIAVGVALVLGLTGIATIQPYWLALAATGAVAGAVWFATGGVYLRRAGRDPGPLSDTERGPGESERPGRAGSE